MTFLVKIKNKKRFEENCEELKVETLEDLLSFFIGIIFEKFLVNICVVVEYIQFHGLVGIIINLRHDSAKISLWLP